MQKLLFLILIFLYGTSQAGFLNDLTNALNGGAYRKHDSSNKTIYKTKSKFNKYCSSNTTNYGIQIKCTTTDIVTTINTESDNTIRCKQINFGVSQNYPASIVVSDSILSKLNTCDGDIIGPNKINHFNIAPNPGGAYIQTNMTDTYYDIVCPNKMPYNKDLYVKLQESAHNVQNSNYYYCLNTTQPAAHNFVKMFYLCIVIAIIALLLFIYKKYKNKIKK